MSLELATPDELVYQFHPVTTGSLHFKVRAANDAHIALTSGPEESDPMWEVFIGGWSNSKSVIRKNRTKPDVVEGNTPEILSANEFRGFWITWADGTISVGKEGEPVGFLTWTDPEPFGIGYYGICTGWGASGTWIIEGSSTQLSTIDSGDCLTYDFRPIRQGSVEFEVRSLSNAHIALTTAPRETDQMYEIILGGWENTASVIRRNREKPDKVREETPSLLNQGEYRRFLVEWEEGHLRVEHKGSTLISWRDDTPIGISHFGVRTGWGATGLWHIQPMDPRRRTREDAAEEELNQGNEADVEDEINEETSEQPELENEEATTQPGWNVPAPSAGGPGNWVNAAGGEVPEGAVPGGFDQEQIYVARASHEGALIPGKLVPSHGVAYVSWGGAEHGKSEYEVLCGASPQWVASTDGQVPPGALEAGKTEDGETLYVGRVEHNGSVALGKVQISHNVCYIPYGGEELSFPEYEVLSGRQELVSQPRKQPPELPILRSSSANPTMELSPLNVIVYECQLEAGSYSKVQAIGQDMNCLSLNFVCGEEGSIWLCDGSDASEISITNDGIQLSHTQVPEQKDADWTATVNEDNGSDVGLRVRIEWENLDCGCEVTITGYTPSGDALDSFEKHQLPHQVTSFLVGNQLSNGLYQVILANHLGVGWVPTGWGLHPSTATRFSTSEKNETEDLDNYSYVCLGRARQNRHAWNTSSIPGELVPMKALSFEYDSEMHYSNTYEVLCNVRTDWRWHGEGDSIDDTAVLADFSSEPKYIGRVTSEEGDKLIGKVEYRGDDNNDFVCHFFHEGEPHITQEYDYLVISK